MTSTLSVLDKRTSSPKLSNNQQLVSNKKYSFHLPKLPSGSQMAKAGLVVAASLGTSSLVGSIADQLLDNKKNIKHNFVKEALIGFAQSFLAILSALYVSRGLHNGAFKLNSWKNALGAFNKKSFVLATSIAAFNVFLEWCSEAAQKAKPQLKKAISLISLSAKLLGSIGLVKLIGGINPDASLGAVAGGCPCCASPFFICLADLAALAQSLSQPVYHWAQNSYLKLKNHLQNSLSKNQ